MESYILKLKRPRFTPSKRPLLLFSAAFSVVAMMVTALMRHELWVGFGVSALAGLVYLIVGGLSLVPLNRALLLGFGVGMIWCWGYVTIFYCPVLVHEGQTATIQFRADNYAKGYGDYGMVTGTVLVINGEETGYKAKVYLTDGSPDHSPGDILSFTGKIALADQSITKNNLQNGIFLRITQIDALTVTKVRPTLLNRAAIFSHALKERLYQMLEGEEATLLVALLTGDRTDFSDELYRSLTVSGSTHITAVSGMHISMLVALMVALLGKRRGLYAALPVVLSFAAIAGMSPSVLRAVIMCSFTVAAFALRQEGDTLTSLFAALLILTAVNPFGSLSAGLLLSFASTLGIVLFTPMLTHFFGKYKPKKLVWVYRSLTASIAMSVSAMVFTMPLCTLLFDSVSLVSALTTLLVTWAVTLSMLLAVVILLVSIYIWPLAVFLVRYVLDLPLTYMTWVIHKIGNLPWAVLNGGNLYLIIAVLTLMGVMIAAWRNRIKTAVSFGLVLLSFCACFAITAWERNAYTEIRLLANGDSPVIMLRSSGSVTILGVGDGMMVRNVDDTLLEWGVASADILMITNTKPRMVTGLSAMAARTRAKAVVSPRGAMISLDNDKAAQLWYDEEGSFRSGSFTVTLLAAGEGYAAYIEGSGITLLSLAGVTPMEALAVLDCAADFLVVDKAYAAVPYTLERLCAIIQPQLIYYCDDSFGYSGTVKVGDIPIITASENGKLTLLSRKGN